MSQTRVGQPIGGTLHRVAELEPALDLQARLPGAAPWWRADRLLDGSVAQVVTGRAEQLRRLYPQADPAVARQVAAGVLLAHWSWAVATVAVGAWLVDRRIPLLRPESVALRLDPYAVGGVGLAPGPFWCAADDPDAAHRDARAAPDLARVLWEELGRHLSAVHPALTDSAVGLRMGRRTLLASVGDAVAGAVVRLAPQQAQPAVAAELDAAAPAGVRLGVQPCPGGLRRRRGSCCFWYRLPGESACDGCPLADRGGSGRRDAART